MGIIINKIAKSKANPLLVILLIAFAVFIIGPKLGLFSVTENCQNYTLNLNQTLIDRMGENEHAHNPYILSCADLKRTYCLDRPNTTSGSRGVWDSANDVCQNFDITPLSCNQLFQLGCTGAFYRIDSPNSCTQIDNATAWGLILSGNYPSDLMPLLSFPISSYNGTLAIMDHEIDSCSTTNPPPTNPNFFMQEVFKIGTFSVVWWMIIATGGLILLIILFKK